MPELKDKKQLAAIAQATAKGYELVQHRSVTYIPVHWQTYNVEPLPPLSERVWAPLVVQEKQQLAFKHDVLFANPSELHSFDFMLQQWAQQRTQVIDTILVRTGTGLMKLDELGELVDHDGEFTPNYLRPMLNTNQADKDEVFKVLVEWLGNDEEATSLLHHVATALAPGYSAVKYVLLIGEGRNGKGVLLAMIKALFGAWNISSISRQSMAETSPVVTELNGKLLNVIFDGQEGYIKDSSSEKTLIAGEPLAIRKLYENATTEVQTNALFIEALNNEPKSRDKSPALMKRLVRFQFPNVYPQDKAFHKHMTSEKMLGAFLALLIDHYVMESEVAEKLAPTGKSLELQVEQAWLNSPVLQYLEYVYTQDPNKLDEVTGGQMELDTFMASFVPWMQAQGHSERSTADLVNMLKTHFDINWKVKKINGKPVNKKRLRSVKAETELAINQMKGNSNAEPE